jgi:hypothetical protein
MYYAPYEQRELHILCTFTFYISISINMAVGTCETRMTLVLLNKEGF